MTPCTIETQVKSSTVSSIVIYSESEENAVQYMTELQLKGAMFYTFLSSN